MRSNSASPVHLRPARALALLVAVAGLMLSTGAFITPASTQPVAPKPKPSPTALTPPTLAPRDGAFVEGTHAVASTPTTAEDSVASLWVDDRQLVASPTVGTSTFSFDVGSNSIERRYGNHLLVNGEHRIDLPDLVDERATLEIPNDELVQGENSIQVITGTIASDCGINHDDFILSNLSLELLGEVADGEENAYSYSMGDGSCGSNTALAEGGHTHLLHPRRPGRHHRPDLPARHVRADQRHAHPDRRHGVGRAGRAHGHRQQRTRRGAAADAGRRHDSGR